MKRESEYDCIRLYIDIDSNNQFSSYDLFWLKNYLAIKYEYYQLTESFYDEWEDYQIDPDESFPHPNTFYPPILEII